MSIIIITMETQAKDFSPLIYGIVELELQIGTATPLSLDLVLHPFGGFARFKEVLHNASFPEISSFEQAEEYVLAMNRDRKNVGGTNNISARVRPDGSIEIEAQTGEFVNFSYTGTILANVTFDASGNVVPPPAKVFTTEKTGNGNCGANTEEYRALRAQGGTAPYRVNIGSGGDVVTGWNGVDAQTFNLVRGFVYNLTCFDSTGAIIDVDTINPTRNILPTDFELEVTPFTGFSNVQVRRVRTVAGTDPIEYNLITSQGGESGWQSSTIFGGVTPGLYTFKARDLYGCEVQKNVQIQAVTTPEETERVPYFSVSEYNSLAFYKDVETGVDVRPNYYNTPSFCENVALPKNGVFRFPLNQTLTTQFRSSFEQHAVTIYKRGGLPARQIDFQLIQENLGVRERVDCRAFKIQTSFAGIDGGSISATIGMGIYFEGGTQYEPGTTTPKTDPDSPYTSGLPSWAVEGNFVDIVNVGAFEIKKSDLYDPVRDVVYFEIDANFNEGTFIIESAFDRHPYNVYRFDFPTVEIPEEGAYIVIEPGVLENGLFVVDQANIHRSEWMGRLDNVKNYVKVQWSAFRNLGEMLFRDNSVHQMWIKARVRPYGDGSAETNDGDDRTRSLDQQSNLRLRLTAPFLSVRQWRKLDLAMAIGNFGKVLVDDVEVVRLGYTEPEEVGVTNVSNVTVDLGFGGESNAISQEDPVFDITTGSTSIPSSGRQAPQGWQTNGNRLVDDDDNFIKVNDNGIEKYVEIL